MSKSGKTQHEIDEVLAKRLDDLKPFVNNISPKITSGYEWQNWRVKCYKVRNDVVHKGLIPTKNQAEEAIKTGKDLIDHIKTFLV